MSALFTLALTDVFLTYSHLLEFAPGAGKVPLGSILRIVVFLCALVSGNIMRQIGSPLNMRMLLLSCWLLATTLFSSWKGGSVNLLTHSWFPSLLGFLAIRAIFDTTDAVRRGVIAVGFASASIALLSLVAGKLDFMRLGLDSPTLSNPNDLAFALLIGVPGILLFLRSSRGKCYLMRGLLILSTLLAVRTVANTGSRGGLLIILAYGAVFFFSASALNKLKIVLVSLAVGTVFFVSASQSALLRYQTILPFINVDPADQQAIQVSAEESTAGRLQLLTESLKLTVQNPVFGVGPGTYQSAAAAISEQEGRRANWHESHNTYTQVSSENGLPGFILYMSLIIGSFTAANRVRRLAMGVSGLEPLHELASCLLLMLSCFALNGLFDNMAYLPIFPFLAALAGSLEQSAARDFAASEYSMAEFSPTATLQLKAALE